jgi:hypothetical protein
MERASPRTKGGSARGWWKLADTESPLAKGERKLNVCGAHLWDSTLLCGGEVDRRAQGQLGEGLQRAIEGMGISPPNDPGEVQETLLQGAGQDNPFILAGVGGRNLTRRWFLSRTFCCLRERKSRTNWSVPMGAPVTTRSPNARRTPGSAAHAAVMFTPRKLLCFKRLQW